VTAGDSRAGGLSRHTFWIAGVIVVADQATKAIVRGRLPLYASETVVPGLLDLTHVRNTGAAFGILGAVDFPYKAAVIALMATAALVAVAVFAAQLSPHQRLARAGLALILGGAVGNLIDRVAVGYVLDFVDVYWRDWHFWAFNVADAAISVGVAGMLLDLVLPRRQPAP
jgi:signal peptidase II